MRRTFTSIPVRRLPTSTYVYDSTGNPRAQALTTFASDIRRIVNQGLNTISDICKSNDLIHIRTRARASERERAHTRTCTRVLHGMNLQHLFCSRENTTPKLPLCVFHAIIINTAMRVINQRPDGKSGVAVAMATERRRRGCSALLLAINFSPRI